MTSLETLVGVWLAKISLFDVVEAMVEILWVDVFRIVAKFVQNHDTEWQNVSNKESKTKYFLLVDFWVISHLKKSVFH